jgi:hypothetical protein
MQGRCAKKGHAMTTSSRVCVMSCLSAISHILGWGALLAAEQPNFVWILSEDNSKH